MNGLNFDRQAKVLALLVGHESTVKMFNEAYQEALDDLKAEAEAGQSGEIICYRVGRLKTLLFIQTVFNRAMMGMNQANKEKMGSEGLN